MNNLINQSLYGYAIGKNFSKLNNHPSDAVIYSPIHTEDSKEKSEIERAISLLSSSRNTLENKIFLLEEKIKSVSAPHSPIDPMIEAEYTTPLSCQIGAETHKINLLNRHLDTILDSIKL